MKEYFRVYELEARQDAKELKKALKQEKGIWSVDINHRTSVAKVRFNENTISLHRVKIAFLKAGHVVGILRKPDEDKDIDDTDVKQQDMEGAETGRVDTSELIAEKDALEEEKIEERAKQLAEKIILESEKIRRQPHEERIEKARIIEENKLQKHAEKHIAEHETEIEKLETSHRSLLDRLEKIRKETQKSTEGKPEIPEPEKIIEKAKIFREVIDKEKQQALKQIETAKKEEEQRIREELEKQKAEYEKKIEEDRLERERLRKILSRERKKRRIGFAKSLAEGINFFREDVKDARKSIEKKKEDKQREDVIAELDKLKQSLRQQKKGKDSEKEKADARRIEGRLRDRIKQEKENIKTQKKAERKKAWQERFAVYRKRREERKADKEERKKEKLKQKALNEKKAAIEEKKIQLLKNKNQEKEKKQDIKDIKTDGQIKEHINTDKTEDKTDKKQKEEIKKIELDVSVMPDDISQPPKFPRVKNKQDITAEIERLRVKAIFVSIFAVPLLYIYLAPALGFKLGYFIERYILIFQFLLSTPILIFGYRIFLKGLRSVINKKLNTYTLISASTAIAYIYSIIVSLLMLAGRISPREVYFDISGLVIAFVILGYFLESRTHTRVISGIKRLVNLRPKFARLTRDMEEIEIPVDKIKKDDIINIKPNENIPFDGTIIEGYSVADESMVTGSWGYVNKEAGDNVIGGTFNKEGAFNCRVDKIKENSLLMQLVRQIMDIGKRKAGFEKYSEKTGVMLAPIVIIIAVIAFFAWLGSGSALSNALSVLIIACPAVFGLSVKTASLVAGSTGIRHGILIKGNDVIQKTQDIRAVVISKSGVISEERPNLIEIINYGKFRKNDILKLAASAETGLIHPIADELRHQALVKDIRLFKPSQTRSIAGGIQAKIRGKNILVGRIGLMKKKDISISKIEKDLDKMQESGKSIVIVAIGKKVAGVLVFAYKLNTYCKEMVSDLQKMGKKVIILTGDNRITSEITARYLGADHVLYEMSVNDKIKALKKLQGRGKIAFVGMSTDSELISQSDIGIAFDTRNLESSKDIILLKNSLLDLSSVFRLSRTALRKMKQNLLFSYIYNIAGVLIAAGIFSGILAGIIISPVLAGLLLAVCPLLIMYNSLMLSFFMPKIHTIRKSKSE